MTESQRTRFYGPAWRRAFSACWMEAAGVAFPKEGRPSALRESGLPTPDQVDELATGFARQAFRSVTAADLRRAVRMIATGRDVVSAQRLSNQDVQRVVAAFRILADPDDLDAVIDYGLTGRSQGALVRWIEASGLGGPYVESLSRDLYGTSNWRSMAPEPFYRLARLVWKRAHDQKEARATS